MFNPFVWLDSVLLGAAQKFCDKVQRTTGMMKFSLERIALVVILSSVLPIKDLIPIMGSAIAMMTVVLASMLVFVSVVEERLFIKTNLLRRPVFSGFFSRITWTLLLGSSLCFIIPVVAMGVMLRIPKSSILLGGLIGLAMVGMISYMYISACIPRPPSKSKMQEWLNKGLWWLNDQLKPSPAFVPIQING